MSGAVTDTPRGKNSRGDSQDIDYQAGIQSAGQVRAGERIRRRCIREDGERLSGDKGASYVKYEGDEKIADNQGYISYAKYGGENKEKSKVGKMIRAKDKRGRQ